MKPLSEAILSRVEQPSGLTVVQHLVMPSLAFGASESMYVRLLNDRVRASMAERRLQFDVGGRASFDTFFNSVTVGAWKGPADVPNLQLNLRGSGRYVVRLGLHRIGHAQRWLDEREVTLKPQQSLSIDIDAWAALAHGMLYFALEALEAGCLEAGYFSTRAVPRRKVKLGIVITHFNRKPQVLPAIRRVRNELLNDPAYQGRIELIVVDNSQTITAQEAEGVTLIANKNLGGSGGFTRGLLHLKDRNDFTHCLFMDDDASCEIDAIRRAYSFAQFAKDPDLAIAGSLLREIEPYRLWEKGAQFDGVCRPLKNGLDMREVDHLLIAENIDRAPDFGAWWFFLFGISSVRSFPFPFFVRGDDVLFGLMNKFPIATLNGVGCWGDDFGLKAGPLPFYLDVRNHIVQYMRLGKGRWYSLYKLLGFFVGSVFSYNYASARAITKAIRDAMRGPELFTSNMEMDGIRQDIAAFSVQERLGPIQRSAFNVTYRGVDESRWRFVLRWLTLNGFLLPGFLLKDDVVFQHKGFRGTFRSIFRARRVLYEYEPLSIGYVAQHEKKKFFAECARFLMAVAHFVVRYGAVRNKYMQELDVMTSEKFWRDVYAR